MRVNALNFDVMIDILNSPIFLLVLGVWWLASCMAVAFVGEKRGRSLGIWFLAAVVFSPLLAILLLIGMPVEIPERAIQETGDKFSSRAEFQL